MALTEDHKLFSFGKGKTGVLGLGNSKTVNVPTLVEGITEKDVVAITAGSSHVACLVRSDSE